MITKDKWEWFGVSGHWIYGTWCRFHLYTKVGKYVISTVGEYIPPHRTGGSEKTEHEFLNKNPLGEPIERACVAGSKDKFYETMVFLAGPRCREPSCECCVPSLKTATELDAKRSETRKEAQKAHMTLCLKYAKAS